MARKMPRHCQQFEVPDVPALRSTDDEHHLIGHLDPDSSRRPSDLELLAQLGLRTEWWGRIDPDRGSAWENLAGIRSWAECAMAAVLYDPSSLHSVWRRPADGRGSFPG